MNYNKYFDKCLQQKMPIDNTTSLYITKRWLCVFHNNFNVIQYTPWILKLKHKLSAFISPFVTSTCGFNILCTANNNGGEPVIIKKLTIRKSNWYTRKYSTVESYASELEVKYYIQCKMEISIYYNQWGCIDNEPKTTQKSTQYHKAQYSDTGKNMAS